METDGRKLVVRKRRGDDRTVSDMMETVDSGVDNAQTYCEQLLQRYLSGRASISPTTKQTIEHILSKYHEVATSSGLVQHASTGEMELREGIKVNFKFLKTCLGKHARMLAEINNLGVYQYCSRYGDYYRRFLYTFRRTLKAVVAPSWRRSCRTGFCGKFWSSTAGVLLLTQSTWKRRPTKNGRSHLRLSGPTTGAGQQSQRQISYGLVRAFEDTWILIMCYGSSSYTFTGTMRRTVISIN